MGVRPEFRQHGVAEMLVLRIIEEGMFKLEFKGELSMTLENNVMINRDPRSDRSAALQDISHLQQINRVGGTPIVFPDAPTERDAFRLPDRISIIFPAKCQMIQFHFPFQRWHALPLANRRCLSPSRRPRPP